MTIVVDQTKDQEFMSAIQTGASKLVESSNAIYAKVSYANPNRRGEADPAVLTKKIVHTARAKISTAHKSISGIVPNYKGIGICVQ